MEVALLVPGHWAPAKKTPVVAWAFEGGGSHPRADLGAPRDGHCTMQVVPAGSRAPARQTPTPTNPSLAARRGACVRGIVPPKYMLRS